MLIYALIIAYAMLFAAVFYRYDLWETEPWYTLLAAFLISAVATWGYGYFASWVNDQLAWVGPPRFVGALTAGIGEELLKLMVVVVIWWIFPREFNDPFDGIIYGAYAGLGFAATESCTYSFYAAAGSELAMAAEHLVRFVLHAMMGALSGSGLGFAVAGLKVWPKIFLLVAAASMLLHFTWDFTVGIQGSALGSESEQRGMAFLTMTVLMGIFVAVVAFASRSSEQIHGRGRKKRMVRWPFSLLFRDRD